MSDFTKGPWNKNRFGEIVDTNGDLVRIEGFALSGISNPETRANRDIAFAAPDLLEALECALSALAHCKADAGYSSMQSRAASIADKAIKKARGQS